MMKTKLIVALTSLVLAFAACQKDPDETTEPPIEETQDYQPTTAGSTWQYTSSSSGAYTETAVGTDSTIEGEKYFVFDDGVNGRRYINKSGGVYKSYSYLEAIDANLKLTYLKDAAIGTSWEDVINYDYNGLTVPITFKYTIASRDGDKTVNNKTYNNVIAVAVKISASSILVGGDGTVATGQQFYAKGVGSISSVLNFDALGTTISDSTYLTSYDIK